MSFNANHIRRFCRGERRQSVALSTLTSVIANREWRQFDKTTAFSHQRSICANLCRRSMCGAHTKSQIAHRGGQSKSLLCAQILRVCFDQFVRERPIKIAMRPLCAHEKTHHTGGSMVGRREETRRWKYTGTAAGGKINPAGDARRRRSGNLGKPGILGHKPHYSAPNAPNDP